MGTVLTSVSMASVGFAQSAMVLMALLFLAGLGSSTQHPLASSAISNTNEGKASRVALSTYNFSGDIGKLIVPGSAALLVSFLGWRHTIGAIGLCGLADRRPDCGGPAQPAAAAEVAASSIAERVLAAQLRQPAAVFGLVRHWHSGQRHTHGVPDVHALCAARQGRGVTAIGLALSLVFAGGAFGKFVCGVLATRVGILTSVIVTELATTAD